MNLNAADAFLGGIQMNIWAKGTSSNAAGNIEYRHESGNFTFLGDNFETRYDDPTGLWTGNMSQATDTSPLTFGTAGVTEIDDDAWGIRYTGAAAAGTWSCDYPLVQPLLFFRDAFGCSISSDTLWVEQSGDAGTAWNEIDSAYGANPGTLGNNVTLANGASSKRIKIPVPQFWLSETRANPPATAYSAPGNTTAFPAGRLITSLKPYLFCWATAEGFGLTIEIGASGISNLANGARSAQNIDPCLTPTLWPVSGELLSGNVLASELDDGFDIYVKVTNNSGGAGTFYFTTGLQLIVKHEAAPAGGGSVRGRMGRAGGRRVWAR
jgi:hypothetical protein